MQSFLFHTIDGALVYNPPKLEILKTYVETFHTNYLLLIQNYWKSCYENMSVK